MLKVPIAIRSMFNSKFSTKKLTATNKRRKDFDLRS